MHDIQNQHVALQIRSHHWRSTIPFKPFYIYNAIFRRRWTLLAILKKQVCALIDFLPPCKLTCLNISGTGIPFHRKQWHALKHTCSAALQVVVELSRLHLLQRFCLNFKNNRGLGSNFVRLKELFLTYYFVQLPNHQPIPFSNFNGEQNMGPCLLRSLDAERNTKKGLSSCRPRRSRCKTGSYAIRRLIFSWLRNPRVYKNGNILPRLLQASPASEIERRTSCKQSS